MADENLLTVYTVEGYPCDRCRCNAGICIGAGVEYETYTSIVLCEADARTVRDKLTRLLRRTKEKADGEEG